MNYKIVTITSSFWPGNLRGLADKLEKAVNEAIAQGWEPLGGPVIWGQQVMQAMIKRR